FVRQTLIDNQRARLQLRQTGDMLPPTHIRPPGDVLCAAARSNTLSLRVVRLEDGIASPTRGALSFIAPPERRNPAVDSLRQEVCVLDRDLREPVDVIRD